MTAVNDYVKEQKFAELEKVKEERRVRVVRDGYFVFFFKKKISLSPLKHLLKINTNINLSHLFKIKYLFKNQNRQSVDVSFTDVVVGDVLVSF